MCPITVAADSCPLLLLDLPLRAWGADVTLAFASADLVAAASGDGELALAFSCEVPVMVLFEGLDADGPDAQGLIAVDIPTGESPVRQVVAGFDRAGTAMRITVVVVQPAQAALLERLHADGRTEFAAAGTSLPADARVSQVVGARGIAILTATGRPGDAPAEVAGAGHLLPPSLESLGVYRGRGTYLATVDLTGIDDLLLVGAADLTDLSIAGRAEPTMAGFGATERIDVRDVSGPVELRGTVEIWGHANFDDVRLPALRLGALRGLGTVWTVTGTRDLSAHWTVSGAAPMGRRSGPDPLAGWLEQHPGGTADHLQPLPGSCPGHDLRPAPGRACRPRDGDGRRR